MTTMTIPSSETAFTATLRRHPDRQKTRTPTLLLPRVCRCHATIVALLFAMVRVYHLLFYYYSHLVFYDVLCIATVQILFILETQTNTYKILCCLRRRPPSTTQPKGCHWCHEFQANHEIRVCDRCDAFYCRGCDEMDQCEDCSEVVCNTCSTLMSCKFCGCGLCEDCATACGR